MQIVSKVNNMHEMSSHIFFLLSGKNMKNSINLSLAEFAGGMLSVNTVEPRYLELAYFELPLISK